MAVILSGKAELLECAGCGELYLVGDSPNRGTEEAAKAWTEKHRTGCPSTITLMAAAPKLLDVLVELVAPRLRELASAASALRASTSDQIEETLARSAQRAAGDLARLVHEKLELGLLPGRLELASRRIHDLEGTVEGLEAQAREARLAVARAMPGEQLEPYTVLGVVSKALDELALVQRIREQQARMLGELPGLREELGYWKTHARRFYRADGTFELLEKPEQVEAQRIAAAAKIADLERLVEALRFETGLGADGDADALVTWVVETKDQLRRAPDGQPEPLEPPPEDPLDETARTGSL